MGIQEKGTKLQRHDSELSQALERQGELLEELRAMGIVEMVEKMIDPQALRIHSPNEEQHQPHNGSLWVSPDNTLPLPLRQTKVSIEDVEKALINIQKQEWEANTLLPQQREDGSLDPTIIIDIKKVHNEDLRNMTYLYYGGEIEEHVHVSYSPQKALTIQGAETTFESVVDIQNVDRDAVKTALALAFINPKKTEVPVKYDLRPIRVFEGFQPGESFTG